MYLDSFKKQSALLIDKYREDGAYLAWVMALYLQRNDVDELANDALTDGKDDKKIDFLDLDTGSGTITIAQGYYASKDKEEAPSNKASDLNTAVAWFVSGNLSEIPDNLSTIIGSCREAIKGGEINKIELLYVHNVFESENCKRELTTAAKHLAKLLEECDIDVSSRELGRTSVETLFLEQQSQILVKDDIEIDGKILYTEEATGWSAYNYSVSGEWLKNLYDKYSEDLFSANYRGFLGVGKRKKINNAIKQSAENESENFWVYNNGITILTLGVNDTNPDKTVLHGISIINGAQTTGSIGSVEKKEKLANVKVLCRVVQCKEPDIIPKIVKANNTQNEITSWDRYSNSVEQRAIKDKFAVYGKEYSLKRGMKESTSDLGVYTVAQPTLAFEGNYAEANRGKNNIFANKYLYESIFNNNTKARHLLFIYTLAKAVDEMKYIIKFQSSQKVELTDNERKEIALFRNLKFKMCFIWIVGNCLEAIVGKKVDIKKVAFNKEESKKDIDFLKQKWIEIANSVLKILVSLMGGEDFNEYINDKEQLDELCKNIITQLEVFRTLQGPEKFVEFEKMIWNG